MEQTEVINLTLRADYVWGSIAIIGFLTVCLILAYVLPDTNRKTMTWDGTKDALGLGRLPGPLFALALMIWALFLIILLAGLLWIVTSTAFGAMSLADLDGNDLRWGLFRIAGLVTVAGALIALPLTLLRTQYNRRQTETAEQGQMTDRISKAVEQLGMEKTVTRIGRPVRILTGTASTFTHLVPDPTDFTIGPREKELNRYTDITYIDEEPDGFQGLHVEVKSWETERTVIEWQNESIPVADGEAIAEVLNWEVFSETLPNIEVRLGGIYALERIANDSVEYDKGRDYFQVLELLCAYVRENCPVVDLIPREPPFKRVEPRSDIQAAITVLGRRSVTGRKMEQERRFRLDLCNCDLSFVDFFRGDFTATNFTGSRV